MSFDEEYCYDLEEKIEKYEETLSSLEQQNEELSKNLENALSELEYKNTLLEEKKKIKRLKFWESFPLYILGFFVLLSIILLIVSFF